MALMLLSVISVAVYLTTASIAQSLRTEKKQEDFNRPKPTRPIKPSIPDANRFQSNKVFLENADSLYRPQFDYEEKQIVKGNVKFRQGGLWMFCDSAYYYPELNSLDAFGHVRMEQGDTLFVYSDKLYYDGYQKMAILTHGPTQKQVKLKDSRMTLTTDSLDYDMLNERGWYTTGGKLEDKVNTLTSVYGEYSPATKKATFRNDVLLVNRQNGYRMTTEELDYNTDTNIANINTSTLIEGANDTIITTAGWYDTRTDNAELTARSTIIHRDSLDNVTTLEGDSIIYDKASRISRAYMFRSPWKTAAPMVLTDTARKMILIGGYGEYNDSTRSAFSTVYPLLMEYSRPDTLYLRADTIETSIRIEKVWPEGYRPPISAETRARLEAFNSLQEIAESMHLTITLLPDWLVEVQVDDEEDTGDNGNTETVAENIRERINEDSLTVSGEFYSGVNDSVVTSTVDSVRVGKMLEKVIGDSIAVNREDTVKRLAEKDTVIPLRPRLDSLGRDSADMVDKEFRVAKAYRMARFFNQELQGIADSMEYQEYDSMLYLFRKPIVWSGEREISGNRIDVHFNDSTTDRAYLPESGLMAEHVEEDFYNQLSGKEMTAYFNNKELRHLYVEGNVEAIFLPMEDDSTYNRLVSAESSFMTVDMDKKELKKLKMWPEVDGTVVPLFLISKNSQKYLPGFQPGLHDVLRPVREWYGDRIRWADDLGEVPEQLELYFAGSRNERRSRKPKSPFEPAETPSALTPDKEEFEITTEGEVMELPPESPSAP